jgi:dihydrofolate reductase
MDRDAISIARQRERNATAGAKLGTGEVRTQYYTASTLDGFIADKQHSLDWLLKFDNIEPSSYADFICDVGAIAMGATTYEWMLAHLDQNGWPYEQPCWVFTSRNLSAPNAARVQFARGDVRPVHEEMRTAAGAKNIWIAGGGELVGQFYDAGLLDELIVQIAPVTLGRDGASPLFRRRVDLLKLISSRALGAGFVELRYELPTARARVD